MDFPGVHLPLPVRRFPFQNAGAALPTARPDCHLVRTAIPHLPIYDSLGVFHYSQTISLASFADTVSRSNHNRSLAGEPAAYSPIRRTHSRQATLHTAFTAQRPGSTAIQVSTLRRTQVVYHKGSPPMHKRRSPRKQGRSLHAIGDRPKSASAGSPRFPPSTHPKLGVRSRHQGFHSYALKRIFRPFFRTGRSD